MNTQDLRDAIRADQGTTCLIPRCTDPWVEMAHIEPSGMGGRANRTPDNLMGLCHYHHDVFDGRQLHGRQTLLNDLALYLKGGIRTERRGARKLTSGGDH